MIISYPSASRSFSRRISAIGFPLAIASLLAGCAPGADPAPVNETAEATQSITRPSISAAELSNDGVNSISFAQAVAAGVIARPQPVIAVEPEAGAATPDSANPLAVIPTADSTEAEVIETPAPTNLTTDETEDSVDSDEDQRVDKGDTDRSQTESTDAVAESPIDQQAVDSNEDSDTQSAGADEQDTSGDTDTETVAEANPVTGADPGNNRADNSDDNSEPVTTFTSHTTPGFNGEVLDDAIRVTWEADPQARGYNVYKQAEYITTVFATEFIDNDVYDQNYYYEIQAFDYSDTLYYIATGLTVSATTLGRTDPNAPQPNADLLNDYELVFADEFTTNSLDSTKWNTAYLWGPDLVINSEEQYYVDIVNEPDFGFNPFTFDGDNLTINSIKTPPELLAKANNQPYLSGVITSYDAFKFTYGYIETRAKVTYGRGYWPAFWLLNAYYVDDKPEIDIMEFIGDNQDVVYHTYHYYDSNGELRSTKSEPTPGIDYTNDFHTYAAEWKPGTIVFYVDGIEVHRITDPKVSRQDMYVIANTALGGWWAGSPDETTPFPGEYTLDYIRVYQKTTPYDDFLLDDGPGNVPYADDIPGQVSPNHRPTPEQWPEGYPDGL